MESFINEFEMKLSFVQFFIETLMTFVVVLSINFRSMKFAYQLSDTKTISAGISLFFFAEIIFNWITEAAKAGWL